MIKFLSKEKQITLAPMSKKKLIKQLAILTTAMVAGLMLVSIAPTAFAQFISPGDNPVAEATGGQGSIRQLVLTMLRFFLGFLGIVAVIMIIYGGILYVTSAGNEDNAGKGKKIITYAIIGIVIIFISFALVNTVLGGLGAGTDQGA